jgi:hypothetical protein
VVHRQHKGSVKTLRLSGSPCRAATIEFDVALLDRFLDARARLVLPHLP